MTIEHAPPKAVGGKGLVLTCRECNSTSGSDLDAALDSLTRIISFGTGDPMEGRGVLRVGENQQRINLRATGNSFFMEGVIAAGHPDVPQNMIAALQRALASEEPLQFEVSFHHPYDLRRSKFVSKSPTDRGNNCLNRVKRLNEAS